MCHGDVARTVRVGVRRDTQVVGTKGTHSPTVWLVPEALQSLGQNKAGQVR